jgi:hypothetical protein
MLVFDFRLHTKRLTDPSWKSKKAMVISVRTTFRVHIRLNGSFWDGNARGTASISKLSSFMLFKDASEVSHEFTFKYSCRFDLFRKILVTRAFRYKPKSNFPFRSLRVFPSLARCFFKRVA